MFQSCLFLEKSLFFIGLCLENRNFRWSVEMASLLQKNFPAMQKLADKALWLMQFTSLLILHGPSRMNLHFYAFSICIISHYDLCAQRISSIFSSNWRCEMNLFVFVIRQFDEIFFNFLVKLKVWINQCLFLSFDNLTRIPQFWIFSSNWKCEMIHCLFLSFGDLTRFF